MVANNAFANVQLAGNNTVMKLISTKATIAKPWRTAVIV